jgi:hypothetical protein
MTDGKKLIAYLKSKDYRIRALNIVYLIGADPDSWEPVQNRMDYWNDPRVVVRDSGEVLISNTATADPGRHYEVNPMNSAGCALLALGQHKDGWVLGKHYGLPALVQRDELLIYRDKEANGIRRGTPRLESGNGINQHGCNGRDGGNTIDRWSAGCMVGKYWKSHLAFIQLCRDSGNTSFDTTLVNSKELQGFTT